MKNWDFCVETLEKVSRTFSRPIAALRSELRRAVTCGYLLCRTVDTIEDSHGLSRAERNELYQYYLAALDDYTAVDAFISLFNEKVNDESDDAILCRNLDRVFGVVSELSPGAQSTLKQWVGEMSRGMAIYSNRGTGQDGFNALLTLGDLERYCFFVAGTVGHLLTELFIEALELENTQTAADMRNQAEEFGLGLQLVNILKDITDDRERQVSFVPRSACSAVGISIEGLTEPRQRNEAHAAIKPIFSRARQALDNAFEYCVSIPNNATDVRLFCLMPLWLAVSTLQHAQGNDDQFNPQSPVKISRPEVEALIGDCMNRVTDDAALREGYESLRSAAAN